MIQPDVLTSLELLAQAPEDAPAEADPDELWIRLTVSQPETHSFIAITMSAHAMMQMLAGLVIDLNQIVRQKRGIERDPGVN